MIILFKSLTKTINFKKTFCSKASSIMSELKKTRYDGRTKKRKWEERRTDKGESLGLKPKEIKLETDKKTEVPVEAIIDKIKRRKFVLLMGYSGVNYFGMQRNPGRSTIEEELLKALKNLDLITDKEFEQVQNMAFQRAARTDKGVSAARQIVSLKLPENLDIEKINNHLPDDIKVFGYRRVTKGFNSKSQCDFRTYTYMLPTVAFANQNEEVNQKTYRASSEILKKVNEVLSNFVGTKNFHNYTSKKKPSDPSAKRYMKSFVCEEPFVRRAVEFAILKVQGQSFMLHQIRKMVGLVLGIIRGLAPYEVMAQSFGQEKVAIPRAPGLGLVLDYVHYDRYNERYGNDGMHEQLTWEDVEDKVQEFKEKYIYPTIVNKEVAEESMLWWIDNKLSRHSYDDADNNESDDENAGGDDENVGDDDDDNGKEKESQENETEEKLTDSPNGNVIDQNTNKSTVSS